MVKPWFKMGLASVEISLFSVIGLLVGTMGLWNNLNCPAPRSPENGLSFIFRNGELVHFRCHPGFVMKGKFVSYCVNNQWTASAPECIPVRKDHHYYREQGQYGHPSTRDDTNYYSHQGRPESTIKRPEYVNEYDLSNSLFDWDTKTRKKGAYGDGPRRLPLINGIWPNQSVQVMALGPQSTPGPMALVREEVNIAELRHKQYQEVAHQRATDPHLDLLPAKRRRGHKKRKKNKKTHDNRSSNVNTTSHFDANAQRETVISLGNTMDGDALSIAFAKNDSSINDRHKYRHYDSSGKRKGKVHGNKKKNRKWNFNQPQENVIARPSRVDTSGLAPYNIHYRRKKPVNNNVAELKRRPVLEVDESTESLNLSEYDGSCVESFYGRDLPMIAPQVPHAFVYRYETKKNTKYPFNTYMQVKYRCLNGYAFADVKVQILNCREAAWVGQVPRCVEKE